MGNIRVKISGEKKILCVQAIQEAVLAGARKWLACKTIGISIRTIQRWEKDPEDKRKGPKTKPRNAFSEEEKENILKIVNSKEYADHSPCKIVPMLADKKIYIASESSIYKILKERKLAAHRERSAIKNPYKPLHLIASEPNQVWSWDITYLKTSIKGMYFFLYLPIDLFSRMIVHWEIHASQNDALASQMIENAYKKNRIKPGQIKLHSDNGGPMKGATMLATLHWLGVTPSFSRPGVSDDNPFSEALFKTLKYCPQFPEHGFENMDEARIWVENFVCWYNEKHLHSGIQWVTPASRHYGQDVKILKDRAAVYENARMTHPYRWSKNIRNWSYQQEVHLNKLKKVSA